MKNLPEQIGLLKTMTILFKFIANGGFSVTALVTRSAEPG